ncbi:DNA (cytosine-5)-methyltransferase 1 [Copidosoma floridanum]|uniref:DNA (cytosine-5)-methyltransferase 1 n=1 Tax=Copidosoma floridanum TaxID=29053 RepID=UPI0006C9659D|nr:DNA (cytosine-5)-methyltransferase 1 [Copidosoma floridanum]XP_014214364.1 DNA (cytosine-5)-methyltransferase 1 [Copidosoma floridanum]
MPALKSTKMVVETNEVSSKVVAANEVPSNGGNDAERKLLEEQQATKKVKTGWGKKESVKTKATKNESVCEICLQKLNDEDLRLYIGHPNDAVDEYSVLLNPKLCLFNGDETDITEGDARALNKVTSFSVYDKNGHVCPFDGGLIERNIDIYFSGYVKPIYEDDSSIEGGIPGKDMGPIVEWWVSGFDGGEQAVISFSTEIGDYVLMEPSEEYAPFMIAVREKSFMSKTVIEFLLEEHNLEYEDLLNKLKTVAMPSGLPKFTEDILLHHAQFICDQILSFDSSATGEDPLLITSPCMRTLVDLAGITFEKGKTVRKGKKYTNRRQEDEWRKGLIRKVQKEKKTAFTKATTTKLVNNLFENFFPDQLANTTDNLAFKRRRCGVCEPCQQPDCGECFACQSMLKFGGPGRTKQACVRRRCPNMEIQEANAEDVEDDTVSEPDAELSLDAHKKMRGSLKSRSCRMEWIGEPVGVDSKGCRFYSALQLENEVISLNEFIYIESIDPSVPLHIVQIKYMWQNKIGIKMIHATWLWRGSQTVLGETASSNELFLVDDCQDVPASYIKCKTAVVYRNMPENWKSDDNVDADFSMDESSEDCSSFYYQKIYDPLTARFKDVMPDVVTDFDTLYRYCASCNRSRDISLSLTRPEVYDKLKEVSRNEVTYGRFKFKGEEFMVGSCVYLLPKTFDFKYPVKPKGIAKIEMKKVDEDMYPEYFRKCNDRIKGSNSDTPEPFDIGYITKILSTSNVILLACTNLNIAVKKLYRPENTCKGESLKQRSDFNEVYWSEEEYVVPFQQIVGKCYLSFVENLDEHVSEWTVKGPNRFYFSLMYDGKNDEFDDPPVKACSIGKVSKKSDKLKSKSKKPENQNVVIDSPPEYPKITTKLRTLDVFAGCGGLSEGLRQAGVTENHWAIEIDECAAQAYRLNNPNTKVFTGDCNKILTKVIQGETVSDGQRLPCKGEVDLLCGGPPCQGFSGMNRFNSRAYSLFKNSLVVSYLSYCDYYRPRFFIMENVRNFVTFRKGVVLKLTLRCLLKMGYQCTFGIVQAGSYGIPQTRRRMIILAAAPGEVLPKLPNPLHVFSKSACNLSVVIDDKKYDPAYSWTESAPYRVVTVRDALSDLPQIKSGKNDEVMNYISEPVSHFQRQIRSGIHESVLIDHICKDLGLLVEARMAHIPTVTGSDWRDLPNIVLPLIDGTHTVKLKYKYHDKKVGKSSTGAFRGVCNCATGKECNPLDRQDNTLIPWCLPHTANRHNNWAGLYGRIEWDGFFSTTITNPEPMGKQGRVLHPEQTRVVSVRECARSQGFPDNFRFYGNVQDKHRQVGNAVPPPLAKAIGLELRKSLHLSQSHVKN